MGAGPAGCVAALSFAGRGADVLLLESRPGISRPLAGEWIHPPGVEVLRRVGIGLTPESLGHPPGRGFVVAPEDGSGPIVLDYPGDARGLTCEHRVLVEELRRTAASHPGVRYIPGANVRSIEGQKLTLDGQEGHVPSTVVAGLIVGADGRSSMARRSLGLPDGRSLVSYMAGVLLEDAELPHEGYGHVFLGGPGPVFACQIGPRRVRLCLDVPVAHGSARQGPGYLDDAYGPALAPCLRGPFRRALADRAVGWTSNQQRRRTHYGREGLALVGDAVGHFHPLTAIGLTLGFLDSAELAASENFAAYRAARSSHSCSAEMLAGSLYRIFTPRDEGTASLRDAVYRIWRRDPAECGRTMQLLYGGETGVGAFSRAFLKVLGTAAGGVARDTLSPRLWGHSLRTLRGFGGWAGWLAAGTLPRLLGPAASSHLSTGPGVPSEPGLSEIQTVGF